MSNLFDTIIESLSAKWKARDVPSSFRCTCGPTIFFRNTLNVEEADDARREKIRRNLREPYRTLLGHFRHEIGHYYWDRLVRDTGWLERFRGLFGDERVGYAAALRANYENGPPADWASRYIRAHASTHP